MGYKVRECYTHHPNPSAQTSTCQTPRSPRDERGGFWAQSGPQANVANWLLAACHHASQNLHGGVSIPPLFVRLVGDVTSAAWVRCSSHSLL